MDLFRHFVSEEHLVPREPSSVHRNSSVFFFRRSVTPSWSTKAFARRENPAAVLTFFTEEPNLKTVLYILHEGVQSPKTVFEPICSCLGLIWLCSDWNLTFHDLHTFLSVSELDIVEKSDVVMQPLPDAGTKAGQGDGGSRFATGKLSRHVRNLGIPVAFANWAFHPRPTSRHLSHLRLGGHPQFRTILAQALRAVRSLFGLFSIFLASWPFFWGIR